MKAYYSRDWVKERCEYVLEATAKAREEMEEEFYKEACRPRWWRKRELTRKEAYQAYLNDHFYIKPHFKYVYDNLICYCKISLMAVEVSEDTHVLLSVKEFERLNQRHF